MTSLNSMRNWIAAAAILCCCVGFASGAVLSVPSSYGTIQDAINAASPGDTIDVAAGTYSVPSVINVNKAVTVQGAGTSTILEVSGTGYRFNMSAAGATLQNVQIKKTDKTGLQNIIYIGASNITIKNNLIWGQFVIGDGEVSRAMEVAVAVSGLLVEGNTIHNLRQPAYINPSTATIKNNYVYVTKGWVISDGSSVTFEGNTWGTGSNANAVDIAIIVDSPATPPPGFYSDIAGMRAANNNARIDDQRSPTYIKYVDAVNGSDSNSGSVASPYKTITKGITEIVAGGSVAVAAGTYAEAIAISKAVTLAGAGRDTTIIDATAATADIAVNVTTPGGNVTVDGFTVKSKGNAYPGESFGMNVASTTAGATITVTNNKFEGTGNPDNNEYGVYVHGTTSAFVFQHNIVTKGGGNPILVEKNPGATDISYNTLDAGSWGMSCYYMTYGGVNVTTLQRFNNNTFDLGTGAAYDYDHRVEALSITGAYISTNGTGGYSNIEIKNNHIYNGHAYGRGIGLYNDSTGDGSGGLISNAVIEGNIIEGLDSNNAGTHGLRFAGRIENIAVTCNVVSGMNDGVLGIVGYYGSHYPASVALANNSLVSNAQAVDWATGAAQLDAQNNWWGTTDSNAIDALVAGDVDFTPWLTKPATCQPNVLYLEPSTASLYIRPTESILVSMNVANLSQMVSACQAMLGYNSTYFADPTGGAIAAGGGAWNEVIYDSWKVGSGVAGEIDTAVGVFSQSSTGTDADGTVCTIALTAKPGVEGVTQVIFRPDLVPDPGLIESTYLANMTGEAVWPTKFGSTNIVIDGTAPVITCPAAVTVGCGEATDPWATGYATATDAYAPIAITYADDRSGLTGCNATGAIVRTWTATDPAGNASTCTQTITVVDTTAPVMTACPANITKSTDAGVCGAAVTFTAPTATDQCYVEGFENAAFQAGDYATNPSISWNEYSSSILRAASGANGIASKSGDAYAVIDSTSLPASPYDYSGAFCRLRGFSRVFGAGWKASVDVYINLDDSAVAAKTYGWDLSIASNNQSGGHLRDFIFHAAADDNTAAGHVLIAASNNSNFTKRNDLENLDHYEIAASGWYTFEGVFRDNAGVLAVDLKLYDATGTLLWTKTLSASSDLIASVVGGNRYMWFTFVAADQLPIDNTQLTRNVPVVCTPASGSFFSKGTTTVTCTATDACGNATSCSFDVTVNDTEKPTITCPADVSRNTDPGVCYATGVPLGTPTTGDNCGVASVTNDAPAQFPKGVTDVTWTVTDTSANTATCVQKVTVTDAQAPTISIDGVTQGTTDLLVSGSVALQGDVVITVSAADNCPMAQKPVVKVTDAASVETTLTAVGSGPWTYTYTVTSATANGIATIAATITDDSTNSTSTSATFTINKNQVTGQVQLEAFVGSSRAVTFVATGGVAAKSWTQTLSFTGGIASFTLTNVPEGTTGISAKTAWTLREKLMIALDTNGQATGVNFLADATAGWADATDHYLRGGDFDGTNSVNILDYSLMKSSWGAGTVADIDGSGTTNTVDYAYMKANWFKVGDAQ
jgi:hypothetical protein